MNDGPLVDAPIGDESYRQSLSALVDNELAPNERAALIGRLAGDPSAAAQIASYRAQNAALKALFPAREPARAPLVIARRAGWLARTGMAAAWVTCGVALGLSAAWLRTDFGGQPAFASDADLAYAVYAPEQRHPVEVPVSDEQHLLAWLSKRLDRTLSAPSLRAHGYSLLGGRLLPGPSGPAAQFMYEDAAGRRLTLYMTTADARPGAMRAMHEANGRSTYYWADGKMGYALSGQAVREDLRSMAVDVRGALGGKPDAWR
ncbi:MAG: anti-sigma factor [Burkholderiaceae bacterium]